METRNFKWIVLTLVGLVLLVGCGSNETTESENTSDEVVEITRIEHVAGETVLEGIPEKVILFDYGILDAMDILGIDVMGLPQSNVPEYLSKYGDDKYEDVGTLQEPNFEKIYELEPDLIIIADRQAELYDEFEEIAPTVQISIMDGEYMDLFKENMNTLGRIFDMEDKVNEEVEAIEAEVAELHDETSNSDKLGMFIMANDGELNVYGKGSRFSVVFNEFGVNPVDDKVDVSTHGQKITYEYIIEEDPDWIFVMDRAAIAGGDTSASDVMENPMLDGVTAVKEGKVTYLSSPIWYVASGGINSTRTMIADIKDGI